MTYEASFTNGDVYGVKGPGDGLGYYAWYLYPENTFETWAEAEKAAQLMNIAYKEGMKAARKDIREVLGL